MYQVELAVFDYNSNPIMLVLYEALQVEVEYLENVEGATCF